MEESPQTEQLTPLERKNEIFGEIFGEPATDFQSEYKALVENKLNQFLSSTDQRETMQTIALYLEYNIPTAFNKENKESDKSYINGIIANLKNQKMQDKLNEIRTDNLA